MSKDYPCWKDSEDYPIPSETSLIQWAWEFFRRNQDYRKDYDEFIGLPDEVKSFGVYQDGSISRFCQCNPSALSGEKIIDYYNRVGKGEIGPPWRYFSERYRLNHLTFCPNPYVGAIPGLGAPFSNVGVKMLTHDFVSTLEKELRAKGGEFAGFKSNGMLPERPGEVVVKLDIDMPLDVQFENIKAALNKVGIKSTFKRRNHISKFNLYLRSYDAKMEGASAKEIADVLCVDDVQSIYNYQTAAEELIQYDYWKLAAQYEWD